MGGGEEKRNLKKRSPLARTVLQQDEWLLCVELRGQRFACVLVTCVSTWFRAVTECVIRPEVTQ